MEEKIIVSGGGEESGGDGDGREEDDGNGNWNSLMILYVDYYLLNILWNVISWKYFSV